MPKLKFKFRGFTSLLMTFSFLISLISGILLYFTPQGRVANWVHWTFWGMDRETWVALHINSSLIFFIIAIFHIYYNWSVLIRYIKKKAMLAINLKFELLVSLILSVFVIVASLYGVQPFATILKWNEDIKTYWTKKAESLPPIPHAESLTIEQFCKQLDIPMDYFIKQMEKNGWKLDNTTDIIEDIAKRNDITPAQIYDAVKTKTSTTAIMDGQGWGSKTLQQVCDEIGKNCDQVINLLASKGITGVNKDQLIKTIAEEHDLKPLDVVNLINENAGEISH